MHTEMIWGFESGLCGIAWGIEYLLANKFISGDSNEVLFDIDQKIMEKDLRRITDYSFETGLAGLACYVSLRLIGKNEETAFDKSFIDELMYACSRMEISDHNSTVGVAMLLDLYNGKRVDYPYIDIIKRIVNKQVDGKQEELSWRNKERPAMGGIFRSMRTARKIWMYRRLLRRCLWMPSPVCMTGSSMRGC